MSSIRLHQPTTSTPEQHDAGLTDFGPGGWKLFGNSAESHVLRPRRRKRTGSQGENEERQDGRSPKERCAAALGNRAKPGGPHLSVLYCPSSAGSAKADS